MAIQLSGHPWLAAKVRVNYSVVTATFCKHCVPRRAQALKGLDMPSFRAVLVYIDKPSTNSTARYAGPVTGFSESAHRE